MSNKAHRKSQTREQKKEQFSQKARRGSNVMLAAVIIGLLMVIGYLVAARSWQTAGIPTVSAQTLQIASGQEEIRIPLSEFNNDRAKFFDATLPSNTTTRFFVVRTSDGIYRAALDACQVCFDAHKGYHQEGNYMVCNKCGRRFPINGIGYGTSGCHPMGLKTTVEGDQLRITTSELTNGSQYF